MNKIILAVMMLLICVACSNNSSTKNRESQENPVVQADHVEVLYFHGKQRCPTCLAIEKNTKAVIENKFSDELKNGTLLFKSVDLSRTENKEIAKKYEVTWSSLFLSQWKDGKETTENLTKDAFAKARTTPESFKEELAKKIKQLLN